MNTFLLSIAAVIGVLTLGYVALLFVFRRVVPTNMVHIVQKSKTTVVYGKGHGAGNTYYEWPSFIPIIGVTVTEFPESIFPVTLGDYEAYDSARLPFVVDVAAFFRVDNAEVAAQRVSSFSELRAQLTAVLQGSVRRILATSNLEDIMQERSSFGERFTQEVDDNIREWGVVSVKTVEFMDIRDSKGSEVIYQIMEKEKSRIDRESRIAIAENGKEASLKEIDAERTIEVQRQDAEQQIGVRTAEKVREIGINDEKTKQEIAKQRKVTTERDMEVKQVTEVRDAEIKKEVAVVAAGEQKDVDVIAAEAEKLATVTRATGDMEAARLEATAIRETGQAKADAEKAMQLAPVEAQIVLAKEIGSNENYQKYLVSIRQIEAGEVVGQVMGEALRDADLKVISNTGDVVSGVGGLGDIFSSATGTKIGAMLEALKNSPEGSKLLEKITGKVDE